MRRQSQHIGQQHPFLTASIGGLAHLGQEADQRVQLLGRDLQGVDGGKGMVQHRPRRIGQPPGPCHGQPVAQLPDRVARLHCGGLCGHPVLPRVGKLGRGPGGRDDNRRRQNIILL
jgi:hypothetical protein